MKQHEKAAKHDEELAEMEESLLAEEESVEEEEIEEPSDEEETSDEGSAPETTETPEEEEEESESVATDEEEPDFSEEEMEQLSEKTRRQMVSLRKRLRETEAQLNEVTHSKEKASVRKETYQPLEDVAKKLKEAPYEGVGPDVSSVSNLPWDEGSRDITPEDYEQHVAKAAEKVVEQKIQREQALASIARDAKYLEDSYELLNPESKDFDRELTQKIYRDFKSMFNSNPNTNLRDFAEPYVKRFKVAREKELEQKKQELEEKVGKQKASQAITSTGPKRPSPTLSEKIDKAKTIEELESLERQL